MNEGPFATAEDLHELLTSPLAAAAADLGARHRADAVLVHVEGSLRPVFVTLSRAAAAARLEGSGLTMPPPGGVVLLFGDEQGVIAVARARCTPMPMDGAA